MVIKCRYVPTRSKPRKISRCDAARFAEKALANATPEEVLGAVMAKLGIDYVMMPQEVSDNVINDRLEGYRQALDGYIVRVEGLFASVDDFLQRHIDKINDVLGYMPDFLLSDTGIGLVDWALDLIRLAYRRITAWLEFLYVVRDELQSWSDEIAEILRFLNDLREFLSTISDIAASKPLYSGDYAC